MVDVEVTPGRSLQDGEYRRVSRRRNRVGTARLLVFADGEVRYHDGSDMPVPDEAESELIRFMEPSEDSTLERISPAPQRRADGRKHPLIWPLP
jgi:hypothetical protein